jgi:polyribonucleotide nucleotidyltransferase
VRCDGRGIDTIRPLSGEVGVLPRTHGSALFARGETQALSIATLAPADEKQEIDNYAGGPDQKRFILHYNFPPFSVGETGRLGGMNRREIGHGALAERSIEPLIPDEADFPYAIRVSSEVMESNGSTSMASVCSGVMALMNAGVPMKRPVAGISVRSRHRVRGRHHEALPHHARHHRQRRPLRRHGLQALRHQRRRHRLPARPQAPRHPARILLEEAIDKAKRPHQGARRDEWHHRHPRRRSAPTPRASRSSRSTPDKIGELIGPGGKNIKGIQAETGAEINIERRRHGVHLRRRKEGSSAPSK